MLDTPRFLDRNLTDKIFPDQIPSPTIVEALVVARAGLGMSIPDNLRGKLFEVILSPVDQMGLSIAIDSHNIALKVMNREEAKNFGLSTASLLTSCLVLLQTIKRGETSDIKRLLLAQAVGMVGLELIQGPHD